MKLYKNISKIIIETPGSIDFYEKRFHLSGNFKPSKKDFGDKLGKTGATYSGVTGDENHQSHLTLRDTDYLVLADDGITDTAKRRVMATKQNPYKPTMIKQGKLDTFQ